MRSIIAASVGTVPVSAGNSRIAPTADHADLTRPRCRSHAPGAHNGIVRNAALALVLAAAVAGVGAAARPASADPTLRRRDTSIVELLRLPYRSSRLFAMPIADVVGAYQLTLSADASLLAEPGVLSFAGVAALGFGDLAQLEYRHTAAISVEHEAAPVPALGVQFKAPIPEGRHLPGVAIAFRLGLPRTEGFSATRVTEKVTDLYLVTRLALWGAAEGVTLHAGARVAQARIEIGGDRAQSAARYVVLPTFGLDVRASRTAHLVAEAGLAPQFRYRTDLPDPPTIGRGLLGRVGVRWFVVPAFSIDGSIGYQLEVAGARAADGLDDVVQWDIRLGAELFVPWGALACKGLGIFCQQGGAP